MKNDKQPNPSGVTSGVLLFALAIAVGMVFLLWLRETGEEWAGYALVLIPAIALLFSRYSSKKKIRTESEQREYDEALKKVQAEARSSKLVKGFRIFVGGLVLLIVFDSLRGILG